MNATQKMIKYLAIAFAMFLAFTIIASIAGVITGIVNGATDSKSDKSRDFSQVYENVDSISIDAYVYNLNVVQGDNYSVDFRNISNKYKATCHNGKLELYYNGFDGLSSWFSSWLAGETNSSKSSIITVTIPANSKLDKFDIDAGTGTVNMNNIDTDDLIIDAGTGSITGGQITAGKTDLDCGTGNITLSDVTLSDSDIDCGTGNVTIDGTFLGKNEFDGGVGNINLNLKGTINDYSLKTESGIGDITIDGKKYSDYTSVNDNTDNSLDIEGGVGNVNIDFEQ